MFFFVCSYSDVGGMVMRDTRSYRYQSHKEGFGGFYRLMMASMLVIAGILGFKINEVKQWVKLPNVVETKLVALSSWFPFEDWFGIGSEPVMASSYLNLVNNLYTNHSNRCSVVSDGVILDIDEQKKSVLVQQDNGILAVYGKLDDITSKVDERVKKGQVIATYQDSLSLDFTYNGIALTYDQAIAKG